MSQQGERPATEDDWWNRLYDESAPDTGPAPAAGDTLDDRFDSASDTVSTPQEGHPNAWWETPELPPLSQRAPWEPPMPPMEPRGRGIAPRPPVTPPQGAAEPPRPLGTPPATAPAPPATAPAPPATAPAPPATAPAPPATAPAQPDAAPTAPPPPGASPREPSPDPAPATPPNRPVVGFVGGGPPTYDAEPTALPAAQPQELGELAPDTVLDGARYGTYTLRAASVRGDSARYRGEPRRDALLTARFGSGDAALVLVAVASGARATEGAHLAAADACRWIGGSVGRSHARLAEDIRAGRRGDLKSGLKRLTDRSFGKLRARAAELGVEPEEYTANLRCLLLSADPECRTRVFFGVGRGGLFRLREGAWQDIEPHVPEPSAMTGAPVVGYGSAPAGTPPAEALAQTLADADAAAETPDGDRLTMDLGIATPPSPYIEAPPPPPAEPFRFRASVARPGDTLLLCSNGLAEPLRGEASLATELAERWAPDDPPGLATFLADTQLRVKGYADDRTAVAVWEA